MFNLDLMNIDFKTTKNLNQDIEKRLHRVKINLSGNTTNCPYSKDCNTSEICSRCNVFYEKCSKNEQFRIKSF